VQREQVVSYLELDARVAAAAAALLARGVGPESRCALSLDDPFALLLAVLGCDRLGATAVLVDPAWPATLRSTALASAAPVQMVDTPLQLPNASPDPSETLGDAETRFLAAFTSGTTGVARAVVRSRRSWTESFVPFTEITGLGAGDVVLVPGPLHSTLFLFGALHALAVGATVVLAPVSPTAPWTAAHVVPALLADLVRQPVPLSGRTVVCAGAALPPTLVDAATDRGLRVVEYYGAAELSFVSAGPPGAMRAFPGTEIEVRGDDGLPGGTGPGQVWVRSRYLSDGYLGGVEGPLVMDGQGFATVGDVGTLSPAGHLTIHGRGDGLIVTGGVSVLPEDVEAALRGAPGVGGLVIVATPHARLGQVVTAVIEPSDNPPRLADLRARAETHLAPAQRPRRWWLTPRLPRTASGKVAREAVSRGLADRSLDAVALR
jgi:long-chain acyl-CoA synthetase